MGCTMTKVSDAELAEACAKICPSALRFAVRRWSVVGCPSESAVVMLASYSIKHKEEWKQVASARDERHLLATLLTSDPFPEPWKS